MGVEEEEGRVPDVAATGLVLPWRLVALTLTLVSVAALAALTVVAAVKSADTLATVALALAVLSFAAQLTVSLVQAQAQAHQLSEVERVNTESRAALAEIRSTVTALLTNQRDQFDRVLEYALRDAVQEAAESVDAASAQSIDIDVIERRIRQSLDDALATRPVPPTSAQPVSANRYAEFADLLSSFPAEQEAQEAIETLRAMGPWQAQNFRRRAERLRSRVSRGFAPFLTMSLRLDEPVAPGTEADVDMGLITMTRISADGERVQYRVELTELGMMVARLMLGQGEIPVWLREGMRRPRSDARDAVT